MTEEQLQYMQYMVDPKGDLQFSLDEVLLAFRWVVKGPRCMRAAGLKVWGTVTEGVGGGQ